MTQYRRQNSRIPLKLNLDLFLISTPYYDNQQIIQKYFRARIAHKLNQYHLCYLLQWLPCVKLLIPHQRPFG